MKETAREAGFPLMRILGLLASACLIVACEEKARTVVAESRERTLFDEQRPLNLRDLPGEGWRQIPPTRFRQINYVAGPEDEVSIFVGRTGGGVLPNASRWMGQFGREAVTKLSDLTPREILNSTGYLLEAQGEYSPGMGKPPRADQAMFGALIPAGSGVLSVKMVGPKEAVEPRRQDFLDYVSSLELIEVNRIPQEREPHQTDG